MTFTIDWAKRSKWLTQALILSGTLNIALIATFAYFSLQEKQDHLTLSLPPKSTKEAPPTNIDLLKAYSILPYQELIFRLENPELVEEGLSKRDLALACLVSFHHFNLNKALGGIALQKREVSFTNSPHQEVLTIPVFAGLSDAHFLAILQYAKTETWPLTSQGIFYEIKRSFDKKDPSLFTSFYLTPEFYSVYTMFTKSGAAVTKEEIVELLKEGGWEPLEKLHQEMRLSLDTSPDKRRSFLTEYLQDHSRKAGELLLALDREFIAKRCSDSQILTLLDLNLPRSEPLELLVKELLLSPRTETVWKKAASFLYSWKGEELKEPYNHEMALQTFCPEHVHIEKAAPVLAAAETIPTALISNPSSGKKKIMHTIEFGDNLWKIARKYKVSIEELKRVNKLESEKLRIGKQLEIPEKK